MKTQGYQETVVSFNLYGEPTKSSNVTYLVNGDELKALREFGKFWHDNQEKFKEDRCI